MAKKTVKKTKSWLQKIHTPHWLTLLLAVIVLFRIPSLFEPFSYGDEMIYLDLGEAVRRGWVLYRDIHDNKPPLLYFTAAIAGNVFWFRALLTGWMMVTTILFWKLTAKMFPKNKSISRVATISFVILSTIPLLEGQTPNAELFMIGPTIVAFYLLYKKTDVNPKTLLTAGILLSVSMHYKVPAVFDAGAIIFLWLIEINKVNLKNLFQLSKKVVILTAGFVIPLLFFMLWYALRGALNQYVVAAFLQNLGYLSSWRPDSVAEPFLVKNGPLIFRGLILLASLSLLYAFKNKLSKQYLFAAAWLMFGLFGVTLSERPYPHYLVQVIPAISILLGMFFADRTVEQSLTIIPLFLALLTPVYFKFWHYPSYPYYKNFALFALGKKNKDEYFDYFGGNTRRNYKIAEFITNNTSRNEYVFVWGDDASTIYALSRRLPPIKYVATYHINDFADPDSVISQFKNKHPVMIIILPNSATYWQLESFILKNYLEMPQISGARVYRYSESVSKLLQNYYQ